MLQSRLKHMVTHNDTTEAGSFSQQNVVLLQEQPRQFETHHALTRTHATACKNLQGHKLVVGRVSATRIMRTGI